MGAQRKREIVVKTAAQWAAVAHPARVEILEYLRAYGPAAVPALAAALGRRGDGLYHHIRRLEQAGLIRACGFERVGKHAQAMYDAAAREVRLGYDHRTGKHAESMQRVTGVVLRTAARGVAGALRRGGLTADGPGKDFWCRLHAVRLTRAELQRLNELLTAADAVVLKALGRRRGAGGRGATNEADRGLQVLLAMWPAGARGAAGEEPTAIRPATRRAARAARESSR